MIKRSLQLSALTLVGLLKTLLRKLYSLAFEPKNLSLLVVDIYRKISLVKTKVISFQAKFKQLKNETFGLLNDCKPAANMCFNESGFCHFAHTESLKGNLVLRIGIQWFKSRLLKTQAGHFRLLHEGIYIPNGVVFADARFQTMHL